MQALNFGSAYPKGDEEALFSLGDAWNKAASQLENLEPELRSVTDKVPQYYVGDGATQISAEFATLFDGKDYSIQKLVSNLHSLGHDTRSTATTIEYTKIQEEAFALLTLWTVGSLMVSLYGNVLVPAYLAIAREGLAVFAESMMKRIALLASRAAFESLAKPLSREIVVPLAQRLAPAALQLGKGALIGAGMGAGLDAGIQAIQLGMGHRDDGFDLKQTFTTSIEWGVGGLASGLAHPLADAALKRTLPGLTPRLGGVVTGGVSGLAGAFGMYGAGLGVQYYDKGNWHDVDKSLSPQMLAGGLAMGGMDAMKAHGGAPHTGEPTGTQARGVPTDAPTKVTPDTNPVHESPTAATDTAAHENGQQPAKADLTTDTDRRAAQTNTTPQTIEQPRSGPVDHAADNTGRTTDSTARPADTGTKVADSGTRPVTSSDRPGESVTPKDATPARPTSESPARAANVAPTEQRSNLVAGAQEKAAPTPVTRTPEVRAPSTEVRAEPATQPTPTRPTDAPVRTDTPVRTDVPSDTPPRTSHPQPITDRSLGDRTPGTADEPVKSPSDPTNGQPNDPGTQPLGGDHQAPKDDSVGNGQDHASQHDQSEPDTPALIVTTTPHPGAEHPLEVRNRIDKTTGVERDPEITKTRAEFEDFYKEQNAEAAKPSDVTPRDAGSPTAEPRYEARRFSYGPDEKLTTLTVKVHLDEIGNVPPEHLREIVDQLHSTTDRGFNTGERLLSGDRLRVELEFVDDPAAAHLKATVDNPHENADPHVWNRDTPPDVLAERLREHLGLSKDDHELTDIDLRHISNDIAHANTDNALDGLPETRTIGRRRLGALEDERFQWDVEDALRDGDRFMVGADPRTNPYGRLINDGGPHEEVRQYNCLDQSLSALSSFYGDPQVGLPRFHDTLPTGEFNGEGEHRGLKRAMYWLGDHELGWGLNSPTPVVEQFAWLHDHISQQGEMSAALVVNTWHARDVDGNLLYEPDGTPTLDGSHATVVVYPKGASGPVWWDPQLGTMSDKPPLDMQLDSASLSFIAIDPNGGITGAGATHSGTGGGVSPTGAHHPAEPGGQPLSDPVRMGLLEGVDSGGTGRGSADSGNGGLPDSQRSDGSGDELRQREAPDHLGQDVRPVDSDRRADTGRPDLSPPVESEHPTDAGGSNRDRVPGDSDVLDRAAGTDHRAPADREQGNLAPADERERNPGTGEPGDGLGDRQPTERDLARTTDPRVLEDTEPDAQSGQAHDQHDEAARRELPDTSEAKATESESAATVGHPQDAAPYLTGEQTAGPTPDTGESNVPRDGSEPTQPTDEVDSRPESPPTRHPETAVPPERPQQVTSVREHPVEHVAGAPEIDGVPRDSVEGSPKPGKSDPETPQPDAAAGNDDAREMATHYKSNSKMDGGLITFDELSPKAKHLVNSLAEAEHIPLRPGEVDVGHLTELQQFSGVEHAIVQNAKGELRLFRGEQTRSRIPGDLRGEYKFVLHTHPEDRLPGPPSEEERRLRRTTTNSMRQDLQSKNTPHIEAVVSRDGQVRFFTNKGLLDLPPGEYPAGGPLNNRGFVVPVEGLEAQPAVEGPTPRNFSPDTPDEGKLHSDNSDQAPASGLSRQEAPSEPGHTEDTRAISLDDAPSPEPYPVEAAPGITSHPTKLTPELSNNFEELRNSTKKVVEAFGDPARADQLPQLRQELATRFDDLGLRNPETETNAWRLFHEHDSKLADYLAKYSHDLLPPSEEAPARSHPEPKTAPEHDAPGGTLSSDPHVTDAAPTPEEKFRRFENNDSGREYGETELGPIRDALPHDELESLRSYSWNSSINDLLRTENPQHELDKQANALLQRNAVKEVFGGHYAPDADKLEAHVNRPDLSGAQGAAIERNRELLDEILNDPYRQGVLESIWKDASHYEKMQRQLGTEPTLDSLRNYVATLDRATSQPLPENVVAVRGIKSVEFMRCQDGGLLGGRDPKQLEGTVQTDEGYLSTTLGETPPGSPRYALDLEIPEGTPAVWLGRESSYPFEGELLVGRQMPYVITDVIAEPTGPNAAGADYLIKAKLLPNNRELGPAWVDAVDSQQHSPLKPEPAEPAGKPGETEIKPAEASVQPVEEPAATTAPPESSVHPDPEGSTPKPNEPEHANEGVGRPLVDSDRPVALTPHLKNRLEELRGHINDVVAAHHDLARTAELPGLRVKLGDLVDKLGLRDKQNWETPWRLFDEHDAALAKYLQQNHEHLLPSLEDLAAVHAKSSSESVGHETSDKPHTDDPDDQADNAIPDADRTATELTHDEQSAIHRYTDPDADVFSDLNHRLRSELELDPAQQKLAADIASGLEKLPAYDGTVWRGTHLTPEQLARYVPGAKVTEPAFTSSSRDSRRIFTSNVEFIIHSESGRDISALSARPGEQEVLFKSGTTFEVRGVVEDPNSGLFGKTRVFLYESSEHAPLHETPADRVGHEDLSGDRGTEHLARETAAGVSFHPDDTALSDLAGLIPEDPNHFTADVHIDKDGNAHINGRDYTPEEFGDLLRNSGWDGKKPIRLVGCDAGANGFAARLAAHLDVDVLAPTKPAWSDAQGRLYNSTAETHPDGTRRPRIPPDGEWETHHPDGTKTRAAEDGFAPGTRDEHKNDLDPVGARDRHIDDHAQEVRDAARLRTGGRDALTSRSPARELTRADVERIERIEEFRDDLNRPGVDPTATKAKLRSELENAGVLRDDKDVLRNDGPAMERRALMTEAGLDVNAVADEIGLRRPPPARTDNDGLPLRGEHADPAAVPRRDVTFAEVDAIVPDKLIHALEKFGVSRKVAVQYIVDNHNDRSRQRYLPDLEGLARQYGIPHGDVLVIDLYTTKLYYEELNRRLRTDTDVDSVAELQQAVNESLSKLPPAAVPELYRSLSVRPGELPAFLVKYSKGAVTEWEAFTSVAGEVGGTWWEQPGENVLFKIRGGVAYDISDFADGLHYKDPPNPGRELLLPGGMVVRVKNVTPHVLPDGTTGHIIELQIVGSAGPTAATP
ncbi:ADP-ribosyltransferase [Nocardia sp. NPDC101769]|uniref:ADP-ribosyltransferase n=1 Tax=Nocardia sp. NPDC101769 TaxID=3364333 RepID=UPI0037FEE733